MNPYIYTSIREDLSPAQRIVQLGHATWEAAQKFPHTGETCSLILLGVKDRAALRRAARHLDVKGIDHVMFFEPDDNMGDSAICTRPVTDPEERKFFQKWDLYRDPASVYTEEERS